MDPEIIIISEVKGRYDITHMWNLKYVTNKLICKTKTYIENKPVTAKAKEGREG